MICNTLTAIRPRMPHTFSCITSKLKTWHEINTTKNWTMYFCSVFTSKYIDRYIMVASKLKTLTIAISIYCSLKAYDVQIE